MNAKDYNCVLKPTLKTFLEIYNGILSTTMPQYTLHCTFVKIMDSKRKCKNGHDTPTLIQYKTRGIRDAGLGSIKPRNRHTFRLAGLGSVVDLNSCDAADSNPWGSAYKVVVNDARTPELLDPAMRICSVFRTVSKEEALVIAGIIAQENKVVFKQTHCRGLFSSAKRSAPWRRGRRSRWSTGLKGRWTQQLIPNLEPWIERKHSEIMLLKSGHGYFRSYLNLDTRRRMNAHGAEVDGGETPEKSLKTKEDQLISFKFNF